MSNAERLSEIARTLPEQMAGEVLNFVGYLQAKAQQGADAHEAGLNAWFDQLPPEALSPEEAAQLDAALQDPAPRVSGEALFKGLGLV